MWVVTIPSASEISTAPKMEKKGREEGEGRREGRKIN
jgi:hypothetical protein